MEEGTWEERMHSLVQSRGFSQDHEPPQTRAYTDLPSTRHWAGFSERKRHQSGPDFHFYCQFSKFFYKGR